MEKISQTLGGNLSVLILAGGEPFLSKDLPKSPARSTGTTGWNRSTSCRTGKSRRIFPDVTRILQECPDLNVTVAIGIDGLREQHEKIRRKPGSWDIAIDTVRRLQAIKKEYKRLDVQTCTCFMNANQDTIFQWYDFLKHELRPDKVSFNHIRPPSGRPQRTGDRSLSLCEARAEDRRGFPPCGH